MRIVITRFITFNAENVTQEVLWALAMVYFVLVTVTVFSILKDTGSAGMKMAWILLVLAAPVLGMAIYCVRSLFSADYQFLKQFGIALSSNNVGRKA